MNNGMIYNFNLKERWSMNEEYRVEKSLHMIVVLVLLIIFSLSSIANNSFQTGVTYYVDNTNGSDDNNGKSVISPWKTIEKVNSFSFTAGDSVLFKRGSVWIGSLVPKTNGNSTAKIIFGAYGTGSLPVIKGSIEKNNLGDWQKHSENIWKSTSTFDIDIGNIIFNRAYLFGIKQWELKHLSSNDEFYYNKTDKKLYIYSPSNPANRYSQVEIVLNRHIVNFSHKSYITFENLNVTKGGAHGFFGSSSSDITIQDCEISYIGGGECPGLYRERYGNGIEFWGESFNQLVQKCRIYEIYDTGVTNQNNRTEQKQENIEYINNMIWNCAMYSFEIWNNSGGASTMKNIYFDNNTCLNAGMGWGTQRSTAVGYHLNLGSNFAVASNINIRNNIFFDGKFLLAQEWVNDTTGWWSEVTMDHNNYFTTSAYQNGWPWLLIREGENNLMGYNWPDGFTSYMRYTGFDSNSVLNYPEFINIDNWDLSLSPSSSCIDAGTPTSANKDFEGKLRPQGSSFDIGAFEYGR